MDKEQLADLWDAFITHLEAKTFTLDEITREHKRLRNLYGSVEAHKRAFLEAAEEWFKNHGGEAGGK